MGLMLTVVVNGKSILEYDRRTRLPGRLRRTLDEMDLDMDRGLRLGDVEIISPDNRQRAQYVAMHLIGAIQADNGGLVSAACAYLADRAPTLKRVCAEDKGDEVTLELIFDQRE
jgi:hypothetical protein